MSVNLNNYESIVTILQQVVKVGKMVLTPFLLIMIRGYPQYLQSKSISQTPSKEEILRLGDEFRLIVGKVDEEIRDY